MRVAYSLIVKSFVVSHVVMCGQLKHASMAEMPFSTKCSVWRKEASFSRESEPRCIASLSAIMIGTYFPCKR